MRKNVFKTIICILCIVSICLVYIIVAFGKPVEKSLSFQEKIGNANYFNPVDGEYYQDAKYRIKANDNTTYILKLFNSIGKVNIPKGNFLCKKQIKIRGKNVSITGVNGKTKIIFGGNALINTQAESVIVNDSKFTRFNKLSAQNITVSGITFEYKRTNLKSPKTILLLSNVNGVKIKDCKFIADLGNSIPVTLLDLYNSCKNVEVNRVSFINTTKADTGGSIWIRNLTNEYFNPNNSAEDITIDKCNFQQNTNDEIIAVFSCRGDVKNVKVTNCILNEESSKNVMALSIYSSENRYPGIVDGVLLENNTINSKYINKYLITIGGEGRKNKVSNITFSNNQINIKGESSNNSDKFIIYASNKGTNIKGVRIYKNVIKTGVLRNTSVICYANEIIENNIIGKCKNGIIGGYISNNSVDGVENAIISPDTADNNNLINTIVGIASNNDNSAIRNNTINLDNKNGYCGIKIRSIHPGQFRLVCNDNTINTFNEKQYGFVVVGPISVDLEINTVVGPGEKLIRLR